MFDPRLRARLARLRPVRLYSLAELALLAAVAVQAARLIWAVLTPVGPVGDWQAAPPAVAGSARALLSSFDPFSGNAIDPDAPAPSAGLVSLALFGTRIDGGGRSSAIIAGPDGVQRSVGVGEEVMPGVVLKSIGFDQVTVSRGGAVNTVQIQQPAATSAIVPIAVPGASLLGTTPVSAPSAAAAPTSFTADQLRNAVAITPHFDGGHLNGLTLRPQGADTLFKAMGLRDGDVLVQVDGKPVNGPGDLDHAVGSVARGGVLGVTVDRSGTRMPLAITVAAP